MTALALETGSGPLGEGNPGFWDPDHALEEGGRGSGGALTS